MIKEISPLPYIDESGIYLMAPFEKFPSFAETATLVNALLATLKRTLKN